MAQVHRICGEPIGFKTVIADDGDLAVVWWCARCQCATNGDECDPPVLNVADVPEDVIAQFLAAAAAQTDRSH